MSCGGIDSIIQSPPATAKVSIGYMKLTSRPCAVSKGCNDARHLDGIQSVFFSYTNPLQCGRALGGLDGGVTVKATRDCFFLAACKFTRQKYDYNHMDLVVYIEKFTLRNVGQEPLLLVR